jgi:hypothetical protein
MKKLNSTGRGYNLEKNRTLIKCTDDPTVVYVFSGHPYDSYMGREDAGTLLLYSLTSNDYRHVHNRELDYERGAKFFIVEKEEDVIGELEPEEQKTYKKFLDRIQKVFG